jgi:hypothetical protein
MAKSKQPSADATDIMHARRLGVFAGRRGLAVTSCPFRADGDARQRALSLAWVRGFLSVRGGESVSYESDEAANIGAVEKSDGAVMTDVAYAWAPITKTVKQDDGTLMVYGPAISTDLDSDGQRFSQEFIDKAMPAWLRDGANVREQHDPKRAVGVGVGLTRGDDGAQLLAAKVVDSEAIKKVDHKVLRGFSVGVREPRIVMGKADAPGGEIVGGRVIEVSLVDRPANGRCLFEMAKADGSGALQPIDDPKVVEHDDTPDATKSDVPDVEKRDFPAKEREEAAESGEAMKDGAYPVKSKSDLRNAIKAVGRGGADHDAIRRHIIARAKALGLTDMIPDNWGPDGALKGSEKTESADGILKALADLDLAKVDGEGPRDESQDLAGARDALGCLAALIQHEAQSLGMGQFDEAIDIQILLRAVDALRWFVEREQAEAAGTAAAAVAMPAVVEMSDAPDLTKSDEPETTTPPEEQSPAVTDESADVATPETPADPAPQSEPAVTKTDVPTLTKADVADLIKTAVAEATTAAEQREKDLIVKVDAQAAALAKATERIDAQSADLTKALSELEAVKALPEPGGPVLTRTAVQDQAARYSDADLLKAEAAKLLQKADGMADLTLREGYRELAEKKLAQAAQIAI